MAMYELWEMRSGNLVGSWSTEAEVLAAIRANYCGPRPPCTMLVVRKAMPAITKQRDA